VSGEDWLAANQRLLVAEFARLRASIAGEDVTAANERAAAARESMPAPAAIDTLAESFGLSSFERDVLLLCAGVEMDGALARQCSMNPDAGGQSFVTFGLTLACLDEAHWSALAPVAALRLWRLLEVRDERALTTSRVSIDERVLHFLAGINYLDARLQTLMSPQIDAAVITDAHARVVEAALAALGVSEGPAPILQLAGDDPGAQIEVARRIAARLGLGLYVLRARDVPHNVHEVDALANLWSRESVLLNSALLLQASDADTAVLVKVADRVRGVVFTSSPQAATIDRLSLSYRVDRPCAAEQSALWREALGDSAEGLNGTLDALAAQFRLGTDTITRTARSLRAKTPGRDLAAELLRACRTSASAKLEGLAQRIEPAASWLDLVLPDSQIMTLRQIASHVRQRMKVYEEWGFGAKSARGLGISVLFSGESGTGKTMAAEVLANDLALDLYRIDLASIVSKYIGETEKNLRRIFEAAEDCGAILLFDEADALFGKRSEVKDSHDRYANIEVSYLLQEMEAYRGLAILTTNLKNALDTAFQRRLRFAVQFPFPDVHMRERIWRGAFPARTPLRPIDHAKLAQLSVPGGSIRNIAMNAAFIAAESDSPVGMNHLLQAARSEATKRERPYSDTETRGWS
jgi:hypothetical protein